MTNLAASTPYSHSKPIAIGSLWLKFLFLFLFLSLNLSLTAQPIRAYMDLQTHTTMHIPYKFFGKGLVYFEDSKPPKISYKHEFKNINYANYLDGNSGARILLNGAIVPEFNHSKRRAKRYVLKQMDYVEAFVLENQEHFAIAKSPQEVRDYIHNTDKTVIIHSIEGAKNLVNSAEDAQYWADQGIAFMTLIHLVDCDLGGAAIRPGFTTHLLNLKGVMRRKFRKKKGRGLTEKGKQAIQWLADAGIMTDLTHMSDASRNDALSLMEAQKIPPLVTHDMFKPIQNHPRGISEADMLRIYQCGGLTSLPISGMSLRAFNPEQRYARILDSLENLEGSDCHCSGSVDSYKFTYTILQGFIEGNVGRIRGDSTLQFEDLSEEEKVDFAIGFQSDFNGWLSHSRPRYGKEGCLEAVPGEEYEEIEVVGMPHPGLLESQWRWLEKEGVDLAPVHRASEKFLQIWEYLLENGGE